jgi:hypothetical protein
MQPICPRTMRFSEGACATADRAPRAASLAYRSGRLAVLFADDKKTLAKLAPARDDRLQPCRFT